MPLLCTPAASPLDNEHLALCRAYAEAQQRCSQHMAAQRAEVARLQSEVVRLRARALVLTAALALQGADQAAEHAHSPAATAALSEGVLRERAPCQRLPLQSSLAEANLVLCQVGCLTHGAYWRGANDQCRRSGQTCVVVASASALQAAAVAPASAVLPVSAAPLVQSRD